MTDPQDADDGSEWRDPEEAARLRDEAFARLMKMPPKPQKDMKLGKRRARPLRDRTEAHDAGTSTSADRD